MKTLQVTNEDFLETQNYFMRNQISQYMNIFMIFASNHIVTDTHVFLEKTSLMIITLISLVFWIILILYGAKDQVFFARLNLLAVVIMGLIVLFIHFYCLFFRQKIFTHQLSTGDQEFVIINVNMYIVFINIVT